VRIEALADLEQVARTAAAFTAGEAQGAVAARGRFIVAVGGGHTPWDDVACAGRSWPDVHVVQVRESLLEHCPLRSEQVHAMPVESADLEAASAQYATTLEEIAGAPVVLDLVHLGLGTDGHTASLVPGDPVLDVTDADVGVTGPYQGRRRMTLTYPILNRARRIVWLVTGREKAEMLARLHDGDRSIPAGRVRQQAAVVLADQKAAAALGRVRSHR
jgi:6-phosphogluconolactonase